MFNWGGMGSCELYSMLVDNRLTSPVRKGTLLQDGMTRYANAHRHKLLRAVLKTTKITIIFFLK